MRRRGSRFVLAALLCAGVAWSRASPPITVDRLVVRPIEEDALPPPTRPDEVPDDDDERDAVRVIARETERGHWDGDAVARVRAVLRGRTPSRAAAIFRMAGFARPIAIRLAISFSSADDEMFAMRIGRKTLLTLSFLRIGVGDWEPTPETRANLSLPFHPRLPAPLAPPPGEGPAKGTYARSDAIGPHRFPSGVLATALRFTLVIRGHTMNVTTSEDLLRDDGSLADRIDAALSNIPAAHLRMIRELVIDPGDHPRRSIAANTTRDGTTVSMFLAGAGRDVPQSALDRTTAHELGHVVSLQQDEAFWARWDAAIAADGIGVSGYGLTNHDEDFAESYVLYLGGGAHDATLRERYPRRFAILDSLMD